MNPVRVAILVGSVRTGSVNRRLAETLVEQSPDGIEPFLVKGLSELPFYDDDLDDRGATLAVRAVREQIASADRVLIATPAYNGRMPAVLANVIDWGSRPYGAGALQGKVVAVVGGSLGQYGSVWAHEEARKSIRIAGGVPLERGAPYRLTGIDLPTELVEQALAVLIDLAAHEEQVAA